MGRMILLSVAVGVVTALAVLLLFRLLGIDLDPAVMGGVVGGVTGASVAMLARKRPPS